MLEEFTSFKNIDQIKNTYQNCKSFYKVGDFRSEF